MSFHSFISNLKLAIVVSSISGAAWAYVVKSGDTLSTIAAKQISKKVYGKSGSLKKIIALNPQIKNPDFIKLGDQVIVSNDQSILAKAETKFFPQVLRSPAEAVPALSEPETSSIKEATPQGYYLFSIEPEFISTKLQGTDSSTGASANLVSKSNYGLRTSYSQVWNSKFQTKFFFGLTKLSIKEPSSGGTLSNADQTMYSYGATLQFKLSENFIIGSGLGVTQRPYLRAISSTLVALDATSVPSALIDASYNLLKVTPFTLGAAFHTSLDLPVSENAYSTKLNPSYGASIYVRHDVNPSFQTELGLRGLYQIENTTIVDQSQTDYGIYLMLHYSFGKTSKVEQKK